MFTLMDDEEEFVPTYSHCQVCRTELFESQEIGICSICSKPHDCEFEYCTSRAAFYAEFLDYELDNHTTQYLCKEHVLKIFLISERVYTVSNLNIFDKLNIISSSALGDSLD